MTSQPLPPGTPVTVTIDAVIMPDEPRPLNGSWLYRVQGTDGRCRWVPAYNLACRDPRQVQT